MLLKKKEQRRKEWQGCAVQCNFKYGGQGRPCWGWHLSKDVRDAGESHRGVCAKILRQRKQTREVLKQGGHTPSAGVTQQQQGGRVSEKESNKRWGQREMEGLLIWCLLGHHADFGFRVWRWSISGLLAPTVTIFLLYLLLPWTTQIAVFCARNEDYHVHSPLDNGFYQECQGSYSNEHIRISGEWEGLWFLSI